MRGTCAGEVKAQPDVTPDFLILIPVNGVTERLRRRLRLSRPPEVSAAPEAEDVGGLTSTRGRLSLKRSCMNASLNFRCSWWICAAVVFCTLLLQPTPAANSPAAVDTNASSNDSLRAYLQLQEQLHATQLALERNRQETEALAARNAEEVATRFKAIESTLTTQRLVELDTMKGAMETLQRSMESNNRLLMTVAGAIASVGFLILLLTAYLQWRSVNRLAEFTALVPAARPGLLPPSPAEAQLLGANVTAQSGRRLSSALTQLEERIFELEHTAHGTTEAQVVVTTENSGAAAPPNGKPGGNGQLEQPDQSAVLLAKGQSLLNLDKPAEALACFDEILRADSTHTEALVKKGMALEQLRELDEALECYDRAIAANHDLTIAYLQKGGLFNRMERYEEALQCYEEALHAQERAHAA